MSRSLSRWQAALLGTAVLAGLGLAVTGLFAVGSRHWLGGDTFHVTVAFPDVGGAEVGTRVRVQGVDAGEVEARDLPDRAGRPVTLKLRLAGRFRGLIGDPATARVQIGSEGLWAPKFVKIIPGRPAAEPLADGAVLRADVAPDLMAELGQAAVQLRQTLRQIDGTLQGIRRGEGTLGQLVTNDQLYRDLARTGREARAALADVTEAVAEVKAALRDLRDGKGTLGRLVKSTEAYAEGLRTIEQVREMVVSVKQNSDAVKSMPIVRSYVVDPHKLLHRPDCTYYRRWYDAKDLFEPGTAVLTGPGRREMVRLADWLKDNLSKKSEVVVASYAPAGLGFEAALTLTQKESEVVCGHLRDHKVHKTGWWWWSTRPVKAVGCGTMASPIPADARRKLPAPRVEIVVFEPQG